jgi:predicted ATPase/class 3 adenylate cyclase
MSAPETVDRRSDLPTGTVTFLFSDIEGSTRLLQTLGDGYPAVLERQAEIVRAAITVGEGVEVGTEGDSFFAVFATPAGAVRAAVAVQRDLAAATWPDDAAVKVRIGIHTGDGRRGGDDYVGLDVHRAPRIASAAHGGQVLISEETETLTGRGLPRDGVDLRDVGHHRLKDLDRPEHLYQLVIDGLPDAFPPIRSLDAGRSNLPEPLTSLVGRERQIEELVALVGDHRLVTLTGPGGTGKTRLAIAAAESLRPGFVDGAFFVPLDLVREAGLVLSLVAQAVGVVETRERSSAEALTDHLRDRVLLLVLDNFEQILEAAPAVEGLLKAAPRIRILVTSRRPLRVYGEQHYPVPPLHLPDLADASRPDDLREVGAVALFVDRARIARPGFEPTDDDVLAIAAIVTRLDGLPLAIELAAARTKVISPRALLGRLEHRLAVLTSTSEGVPDRQRTLRGAIEWSHESLPEPERILIRRLSVFAGGSRLEAIEEVCNPAGEIAADLLDGLSRLVDDSLLLRDDAADGEPRFRLLETIREYAQERLVATDEAGRFIRRHAAYVADLAETLEKDLLGNQQVASLDRLTLEHDNIRAVLRWSAADGDTVLGLRTASAVWRFWQQRSHIREGRGWFALLLAKPDADADPKLQARAVTAAGNLAYWQGDLADAGRSYDQALTLDRGLDDPARIGDDLRNLGFIAMATRDVPKAVRLFGDAVGYLEQGGDRFPLADARASYGASLLLSGDAAAARGYLEASLAVMLELGVLPRAADNSIAMGIVHRRLGDDAEAVRLSRQAIDLVGKLGDATRAPFMLDSIAALAFSRGQAIDAVRLASAAAHLRSIVGGALPNFIEDVAALLTTARDALGGDAFDEAWAAGEALDFDGALRDAHEVLSRT